MLWKAKFIINTTSHGCMKLPQFFSVGALRLGIGHWGLGWEWRVGRVGLAVRGCCFRGNHSCLLLRVVGETQGRRGSHAGQATGTESPPRGKPQLRDPQGPREGGRLNWVTASTQDQAFGQPSHLKGQPCPILQCSTYCMPWVRHSHRSLGNIKSKSWVTVGKKNHSSLGSFSLLPREMETILEFKKIYLGYPHLKTRHLWLC